MVCVSLIHESSRQEQPACHSHECEVPLEDSL